MTESYRPRGMYFQDFQVGNEVVSPGRTIAEADLVNFAALTWDTNPMHTDAEFAKTTPLANASLMGCSAFRTRSDWLGSAVLWKGPSLLSPAWNASSRIQ